MMFFFKIQLIYFSVLIFGSFACAWLLLLLFYGFKFKTNELNKLNSAFEESRNMFSFVVFYCFILFIAFGFHVCFFLTNFFFKKKKKQSYFFNLFDLIVNFFYCFFYLVGECVFKTFLNVGWVVGFSYLYLVKWIFMLRYICFTLIFYPFIKNILDWYQIVRFEWFTDLVADFATTDPSLPAYFWYLWKMRGLSTLAWVTVLCPVMLSMFFVLGGSIEFFEFSQMPKIPFNVYQTEVQLLDLISNYSSSMANACQVQIKAFNLQFYFVKLHNTGFYKIYSTEAFQNLVFKDYYQLLEYNKIYVSEPVLESTSSSSKILSIVCFFTICLLISFAQHYNCFMPALAEWDALGVAYEASLKK